MDTTALQQSLIDIMVKYKDIGVFIAMFLESSVVPIPSEVVVIAAGAVGMPIYSIVLFGSLGSTLGGMVGYLVGRYAAVPLILRFGRYVFIRAHHIEKAEAFAKKYGSASVFIGRLVPIVPFKVFSIAAGITRLRVAPFVLFTMIGVVPRLFLLGLFGQVVVVYTRPVVLIGAVALVGYITFRLVRRRSPEAQ